MANSVSVGCLEQIYRRSTCRHIMHTRLTYFLDYKSLVIKRTSMDACVRTFQIVLDTYVYNLECWKNESANCYLKKVTNYISKEFYNVTVHVRIIYRWLPSTVLGVSTPKKTGVMTSLIVCQMYWFHEKSKKPFWYHCALLKDAIYSAKIWYKHIHTWIDIHVYIYTCPSILHNYIHSYINNTLETNHHHYELLKPVMWQWWTQL